jgi:hypothetical protein
VKRRRSDQAISDDEQIARYAYVLGNVPTSVADRAYAAAFESLPVPQRHEIVDELRSELPFAPEDAASEDPAAFARLMRSLFARDALVRSRHAAALAARFTVSPPVVAYFTTGMGAVSIDQQPPWLHELAGHETAPKDGGRMHHRSGPDFGEGMGLS